MNSSVSIVIPSYRSSYVADAVASAMEQSVEPYEIIVVDSSPESTLPSLNGCRDKITYYYQPPLGVSAARNFGIEKATGRYVALLDADDIWLPGKLEKQIDLLESNLAAGFSFSTVWNLVSTEQNAIPSEPFFPVMLREWMARNKQQKDAVSGWVYDLLLEVNCVATSSLVIRRDAFDEIGFFDESLKNAEDYELELRLAKQYPAVFISEPTSRYRVHDTGLSGAWSARSDLFYRTNINALEKHYQLFPSASVKRAIARTWASYALHLLFCGDPSSAAAYARRSFRLHPSLLALKLLAEASAPSAYRFVSSIIGKGAQRSRNS